MNDCPRQNPAYRLTLGKGVIYVACIVLLTHLLCCEKASLTSSLIEGGTILTQLLEGEGTRRRSWHRSVIEGASMLLTEILLQRINLKKPFDRKEDFRSRKENSQIS